MIHELIQINVGVGVFHILAFDKRGGEFLIGVERALHHRPRDDIANFCAHESGALARLDMLELDDLIDVAVHLKGHAVAEITC